jgi:hypothetical protein
MAMQLGHVHIKTREDPQKVAKFYIDNFGATVKREIPGRGCQLAAGEIRADIGLEDLLRTLVGMCYTRARRHELAAACRGRHFVRSTDR